VIRAALAAVAAAALPAAPQIHVPAGFQAQVYARGLVHPTALAFGPDGSLYATEDTGRVIAVRRGGRPRLVAERLPTPLGLAWLGRDLFVSAQGRLVLIRFRGSRVVGRRSIVEHLPFGEHQQDNVVVGRDGRLYLGSGSTCDACRERNPRSATVLSVKPSGSDLRVVARGLRNPFGLAVQPTTGRIFVSVNGRDKLGRDEPAESVVELRSGRNYGWPACWPSWTRLRLAGACRGITAPVAYLEPHSSADGMTFATATTFGGRYAGQLFVAEWGQYDSTRAGRKLVRVRLGQPRAQVFATGFDHPLAVIRDPTGGLLVSDWGRGVIYRISASP
jgi:glucose/arabinose dehydrogenase